MIGIHKIIALFFQPNIIEIAFTNLRFTSNKIGLRIKNRFIKFIELLNANLINIQFSEAFISHSQTI